MELQNNEENLKRQVNELANHGLKMKWIAKQTGIGESFLCRWRHGNDYYSLNTKKEQALQAFLKSYMGKN